MFSKEEILKRRVKKENKKEKEGHSSWVMLLVLFFLSSGLAMAFYLTSFLPDFWQKITSPRVIRPQDKSTNSPTITIEPTPTPWQQFLGQKLESLIETRSGRYGIYLFYVDKEDDQFLGVNHQERFSAASLMKLPIVITAYREAEKRRFDLTAEYRLKEEDKLAGNGSVHLQPEGTIYTYRNLAKLAIEQSDNTASSVIAKALGEDKIQETIDFFNLAKTNYSLWQTTAEDMGQLLVALYQGKALTPAHSQELIGYLLQTIFNDQIPSALPEEIAVAHKIGLDEQILHDAAIVFTNQGDFVLVIMSQGVSSDQAQKTLEEITKTVWEGFSNQGAV